MNHQQALKTTHSAQVWGTRRSGTDQWDFALWAPSCPPVTLLIEGSEIALERGSDGVHRGSAQAREGARYAFRTEGVVFSDPAALQQAEGVEGRSVLRDPESFRTRPSDWRGRPFDEAVFCELHVGTFTREGTFAAAARSPELRRLAEVGITAIELMPVGQFPGARGWGYDSVLPWAVQHSYGPPEDLVALVDAAHGLGMMVFLDVVFNHFGPTGCILHDICPEFFLDTSNDWGKQIDFSCNEVRAYFGGCAQHWLRAFDLDGLRLDAVHEMKDGSDLHIVEEIARTIRNQDWPHPVHLVAEDSTNKVGWYDPAAGLFDATWDDDYHHALHVLLTGESFGYYKDFAKDPMADLSLALRDGQSLQGQSRPAGLQEKGEPSGHLPPRCFVNFNLNHDHAGNRPQGERLISLVGADRAVVAHALLLSAPYTPLIFMGEEIGSVRPFPWFADYSGSAAERMAKGRRKQFMDLPGKGADMLDPFDPATMRQCWPYAKPWPADAQLWLDVTHAILELRRRVLLPLFRSGRSREAEIRSGRGKALVADWHFRGGTLRAEVSFDGSAVEVPTLDGRTLDGAEELYALGQADAPHFRLSLAG